MARPDLTTLQIDNAVGCHTLGTRRTSRVLDNERRPR
jgi:hypothetical protein